MEDRLTLGRALMEEAMSALSAAFDGPAWLIQHEEGALSGTAHAWTSAVWRKRQYLGRDGGSPLEVLSVLNSVLDRFGLETQDQLTGSASGWLTLNAKGANGIEFHFRSKGYTEVWVTVSQTSAS